MTDWLSEIEDFIERGILLGEEEGIRMARVLRELVAELNNAYMHIDVAYEELPDEKYDAEETLKCTIEARGSRLSDDAKELLG